jgi:hypothetical protein
MHARATQLDGGCFILDSAGRPTRLSFTKSFLPGQGSNVVFRYGAVPGEAALRAIDGMREVYGVRGVKFNEAERTVRVGYDASRMKADAVAKLLRQAGIDVRDAVALA